MAQIRPSIIQAFIRELSESSFGAVSFDVQLPEAGPLIKITFYPQGQYVLQITRLSSGDNNLKVEIAPGEYRSSDIVLCSSIQECIDLIEPWTERIRDDLRATEVNFVLLKEFRETMDAHLRDKVPHSESKFSPQEIEVLVERLAEVSKRLSEMEAKQELNQQQVFELRQAIETAKEDLSKMSKGVWYQAAGGKLWEVMSKVASSPHAHQILADVTRKLIGM